MFPFEFCHSLSDVFCLGFLVPSAILPRNDLNSSSISVKYKPRASYLINKQHAVATIGSLA